MKEEKNVIVRENDSVTSLIAQAIDKNLPVETMERLFTLREKVKLEQARENFVSALARFQSECPIIKKTKKVLSKDGKTVRYQYAPIDSIVDQIQKALANAELSYRWETTQENNEVKAKCIVTHVLGHSESSEFSIPVDKEGYMTQPQKFASALTFAKRYSLCNALGISTGDEDTDATDVGKEPTPKSDKSKIVFLLRTLGYETKTRDAISKKIKELTNLELIEKNLGEIVARLEIIVKENNENPKI